MSAQKPDNSNPEDYYGLIKPQNQLYSASLGGLYADI
jgi:hypothetical protein